MKELTVLAVTENLEQVTDFVNAELEEQGCSMRHMMQIDVAIDEVFANIAGYAYAPNTGDLTIRVGFEDDPHRMVLTFIDSGKPFDPLQREDPDVTLSAAQRQIGGLGIYVVKKTMDRVSYQYLDGKNVFTIEKLF